MKKFKMVLVGEINISSLEHELLKLPVADRLSLAKGLVSCLPEDDRKKLYRFMDKHYEITDWVKK